MEVKFYKDENADAFYVRRKVFVEEQNIPECDEFEYRGTGTGKLLMNSLLEKAKECGYKEIIVYAQTHALGFYGSLGFEEYGEFYIEDKILHKSMKKRIAF